VRQNFYWFRKGKEPMVWMDWASLENALADNPEAYDKLKALEKNFFKRRNPKNQLDIIEFYNGKK
jgi:hypothetical protein